MEENKDTPSAEELLKRIQELEKRHVHMKQQISKLMISRNQPRPNQQMSNSVSSHLQDIGGRAGALEDVVVKEPFSSKLTETQYLNIMQSMGQAVHVFDLNHRIVIWNRTAEKLYGFTQFEAIGKTPTELLVHPKDAAIANYLLELTVKGKSWSGEFPVTNNRGESFVVIYTNTPLRDENKRLIGGMCVSSDSRPYQVINPQISISAPMRIDSQHQQTSNDSKISNLASPVKLKKKIDHEGGDDPSDDAFESDESTPRGPIDPSPFGVFISTGTKDSVTGKFAINSVDESENKPGISKIFSSKAEEWMGKRIVSPWKGNEIEVESSIIRFGAAGWYKMNINHEHEYGLPTSSAKLDLQLGETINVNNNKTEASELWVSSVHDSNTSSSSSLSSDETGIKSNAIIKVDKDPYSLDYEILWEDLITKQQIGQGSCGTVYQGLWHGSDVAIKVFSYQEFPDDLIVSFKQEVSLMKRLRHPNILLFMGAVTSPQHLCIVTEFLPRGSLSRILQRNSTQLDWRRRLHMAMDIARGMNYLHCNNPPIVHRDLKSSNLLVDKSWTVKVGDFGLSRIKHQTFLITKSGKGTPQWMAPEVIRNEQADEKSDVYSYGVVLWEIITEKIPWEDLNPMQVIAAVGFMNRRLEIPKDLDPLWVSLITSCWSSEPQSRPTFKEILHKLKDLQKKYAVERKR